ncbi:ribokinase [Rhodococcus kronopolitis]|uniref:Ribokinase n=1 Tax=Rhodococcus kronopolitis TaxID=1460226 RepID=A0ABV9FMG9_9NOCA
MSTEASAVEAPEIVVVGSANIDTVIRVPRLPTPGETVLGTSVTEFVGGKGANQAVAAARLGRRVSLVGLVGEDAGGAVVRDALRAEGVDTANLRPRAGTSTGIAMIQVDDEGENTVTVVPGANAELDAERVRASELALREARITVLQFEISDEAVVEAVRLAGGTVILNPSPVRPVPGAVMDRVDVLIVNRSELALLAGAPEPATTELAAELAAGVEGPAAVVVTLGADGAVLVRPGGVVVVPAVPVEAVVDPTGAGDTFCGALADALVRGEDLAAAVRWAVRAAAVAVTGPGAQSAMPTRERVLAGASA